jgi:hypothetical protein
MVIAPVSFFLPSANAKNAKGIQNGESTANCQARSAREYGSFQNCLNSATPPQAIATTAVANNMNFVPNCSFMPRIIADQRGGLNFDSRR